MCLRRCRLFQFEFFRGANLIFVCEFPFDIIWQRTLTFRCQSCFYFYRTFCFFDQDKSKHGNVKVQSQADGKYKLYTTYQSVKIIRNYTPRAYVNYISTHFLLAIRTYQKYKRILFLSVKIT